MTREHVEFERRVADILRKIGVEYESHQSIGGLQPDFVLTGPGGKKAIIEVKAWKPEGNTKRAAHQVKKYRDATKSDFAVVVMPKLKRNLLSNGVVNEAGLQKILQNWLSKEWIRYKRVIKP